ncbi:vascular endothelial growth factor receptor 1-like [Diadema antillarum]|uniref:vascular endothelial growth factor receptor 1-like n=1 Tax=Diadema antillarum TaxID=105358 RepID=UPI003A894992
MEVDRMCPYCLHDNLTEGRSYTGLHGTRTHGTGAESAQRSHRTNEGGIRSKHYIGIYSSCAGCQRTCSVTPRWTPGQEDRWLGGGSSYSSGVRLPRGKWNTLSLFFVLLLALGAFEPCLCQIVRVSAPQVSYEIDEGSASSLECNYTISSEHDEGAQDVPRPVAIIAWFKDGVEIARHQGTVRLTPSDVTEGVAIVRPATLFISKTTSSYAGKYTCRVSYGDAVASRNMTLSVLGNKPTIEGYEGLDSATFEGGATLRLTCKGFYPLMWSYPYNIDNARVSIRSTLVQLQLKDSSDWEETNNITIRNATYTDSGLFTCTHSHDGDLSGDGTSLSTEIYAFVTDLTVADNLFLPSDVTNMSIYYGDDLILPCRVTVPDARVTLIRADQTEVPPDELPPYDNRRGFLLNSSTASEFSGRVSCQGSYRGLTAMQSFYIDVIKTPTLHVGNRTMREGSQLSLTCTGGRPLIWKHSSSLSREAVIEVSALRTGDGSLNYRSTLTIKSAYYTDTGRFSCLFLQYFDKDDPSLEESVYIFVIGEDSSHKFLPIDEPSLPYIEYDATLTFVVPCRVSDPHLQVNATVSYKDSQNEYKEFYKLWDLTYNPEIGFIVEPVNTRGKSVISLTFQCTLDIIDEDKEVLPLSFILQRRGGEYVLQEMMQTFDLMILAKLTSSAPFKCIINAPMSDWLYSNCYDGTTSTCNPEDDSSWSLVRDGSATEMIEREGPVTTLRVISSVSKMYRCRAMAPVPGLPDAHQDVDFRVLDEPNGITVSMDPEKVFRTDNVTLTCEVTKFLFDTISWLFAPYGGNASTQLQISEDHSIETIENAPSVYSLSSMLTIHNVSDSDRGEYICQAASSEDLGRTRATSVTVNVTEVEAASIIAHSNLVMVVDVDMDLIIMCSAQGKPTPDLALYRLEGSTRPRQVDAQVEQDGTEVTLTYKPVQTMLTMSGMYQCVAKNRGGAESKNFSVSVVEGPDVTISIEPSNNVYEGDNVTITCRATKGTPTPVVWIEKVGSSTRRRGQPFNFSIDFPSVKADHAGTYRCLASNTIRNASATEVLSVEVVPSKQNQIVQIGVIVTACLLILLIIVIIVIKCHCRRPKVRRASRLSSVQLRPRSMRFMSIYSTAGEDPYENLPYDPRWEFPRERLTLGSVIGKGAFGMVIKAVAVGIDGTEKNIIVAVKQVRAGASSVEKKALWAELKMLGHIGRHLNVVNFLGACTKDGPVLAIVEYCSRGNMLDFLRSKRKYFKGSPEVTGSGSQTGHSSSTGASSFQSSTGSERRMKPVYSSVIVEEPNLQDDPIDVEDLLCYSFQVARGMEFLASKNVIHRDLAARNVLITDNYVVKICDFGLARHLYDDPDYVASGKQGRLPIKWMAPESIFDKVFTTYSDVWAYAVFLWEVFSLGGSPYPGFQMDESFYSKIKNGYRMNAPEHAPPGIYDTMLECWTPEPDARPSFSVLAVRLGDMLEANVRSEYIELNVPYEESNRKAASELPSPHEDTPLLRRPFQTDLETSHHLGTPACCVTVPTIQEAEEIEERSTLSDDTELGVGIRRNGRTGLSTNSQSTWL